MSKTRRAPAALLLTVVVGLTSGCGSSTPVESTNTNAQMAVKFAECMRRNRVSNFPDPRPTGKLTIDAVANGSSVNTNSPAFKQAISTCKHLEPTGFMGTKRSTQQQQAGVKFAQCVRANGVSDFPDPIPNGPLVDTNRIPSAGTSSGMTILNAAMRKCHDRAIAAGVTR